MTNRTIIEIELALAEHFNWKKNVIVTNVTDLSTLVYHECDMLILKGDYLTEVEIKRSWKDFLADFKKKHQHESNIVKHFYYCVPISIIDKVLEYIKTNNIQCKTVISYDEDLKLTYHETGVHPLWNWRKLFLEEKFQLARLGTMRSIPLKYKLLNKEK